MPAKSLSGFTGGLLTLHGQNDQLRLMRPDEQRGALDRFAAVGARLERYRSAREAWLSARRDLIDRRNRARNWPRKPTGSPSRCARSTTSTRAPVRTTR